MDAEILRRLTVPEAIDQLERLYREFRPEIEATDELYRQERVEAMAELQRRLLLLKR